MDDRYIDALKALADPNRLRIFWLLAQINERICVAEAMDVLNQSHYNASRHLKTLLTAGLVTAQKEGKWVFYTLKNEPTPFSQELLAAVRAIPANDFTQEISRCQQRLAMREAGHCVIGSNSEDWEQIFSKRS